MNIKHVSKPRGNRGGLSAALIATGLLTSIAGASAQNIYVDLLSDSSGLGTTTITAPTGYSYSGAAPTAGTSWNTLGLSGATPSGTTGTVSMYSGLSLVDSAGTSITPTLSVSYTYSGTTTKTQPSGGSGEKTIQPGGVMNQMWRNYYNGSGSYLTYTIAGLAASTPFDLYFMGGTTAGSGETVGIALAAGNALGANSTSAYTLNDTMNSDGSYGSLWTSDGGSGYTLMAEGTTWEVLHGQSDASGNFSFDFKTVNNNSDAYLAGFQLVQPVPEPGTTALAALGGLALLMYRRRS